MSAAEVTTEVPLRRNRDFQRLWCGQITSQLATNSAQLTVPLLVLSVTGSAAWAGGVTTMGAVVAAAGRLPGGALADRWSRRWLMLGSDLVRLLASLVLGICVLLDRVSVLLVAIVVAVIAIFEVLFVPAETAAIARVVPVSQLNTAFASNEARRSAASLGGPALGGLLFGFGRAIPFLADAVSYCISFLCIAAIRTPLQEARPPTSRPSMAREIRDGIAHVLNSRFLRAVVLIAAPLNFALTGAIFTVTIALKQAGTPTSTIGLAQATIGAGGLLGAVAASWVIRHLELRRLVILVCAALTAAAAAAAALNGHFVMVIPLAAGFVLAPAANAALYARLGATTPDAVQSRVISVVMLAATGAAALAPGTCGLIIAASGPVAGLLACSAVQAVALLFALSATGLRSLPEDVASQASPS